MRPCGKANRHGGSLEWSNRARAVLVLAGAVRSSQ